MAVLSKASTEPTLAVVIPTWNEEAYLPQLLTSLGCADAADGGASPTHERPDEVLVVDGGSDDATLRLAGEHGARVVSARRGRGTQLARGASETRSEVLLFLHADTRVGPGAIDAVRRAFATPELVASGMRQRIDDGRGIYRWIERAANARVRRGRIYGDSGLAVRRDAYELVGGFRDQPLFEDLDLSRRLRRHGPVRLIEEAELVLSPRRWQRDGPVRRSVMNWLLTVAWWAGVDPRRLVRYYEPHSGTAGET